MGCGSSNAAPPHAALAPARLVVVGQAHPDLQIPAKLDVYTLNKLAPQCSKELPESPNNPDYRLAYGFSTVAHTAKPVLYVIGGVYSDGENAAYGPHIWEISLPPAASTGDTAAGDVTVRQVGDIPATAADSSTDSGAERYAFCRHSNGTDYLYMLGPEYSCRRMDVTKGGGGGAWQELANLPLPAENVAAVFSGYGGLSIATNDGQLLSLDQTTTTPGEWEMKVDAGFPRVGVSAMVGGSDIYTYSADDDALYKCDLLTGDVTPAAAAAEHGLESERMASNVAVAGTHAGALLFSGYHYSADTLSVLEVDLSNRTPAVLAGYLENVSPQHQMFVL